MLSPKQAFPTIREALFYEKLRNEKVKCSLCERRCEISEGEKGFCNTRANIKGRLYTLIYGDISTIESRPIEIKPFFHYWPGSTALTFSTWSCNFDCAWCQNFHLSKSDPKPAKAIHYSPQNIIELAINSGDEGLCASFQEPTLLSEWAIPLFRLAKARKMRYCCYVSNGYMTLEALKALKEAGMDGLKIDIKGNSKVYEKYCGRADVEKIWRNIRKAKSLKIHVEMVNLVITKVNDDDHTLQQLVERHLKKAGPETPLHFTRYFPAWRFNNPPTRTETLEKACEIAEKAGVQYPYIGNIPGHKYENTYCPNCREELVKRYAHTILKYTVTEDKRCPKCRISIPMVGKCLI